MSSRWSAGFTEAAREMAEVITQCGDRREPVVHEKVQQVVPRLGIHGTSRSYRSLESVVVLVGGRGEGLHQDLDRLSGIAGSGHPSACALGRMLAGDQQVDEVHGAITFVVGYRADCCLGVVVDQVEVYCEHSGQRRGVYRDEGATWPAVGVAFPRIRVDPHQIAEHAGDARCSTVFSVHVASVHNARRSVECTVRSGSTGRKPRCTL